MADYIEAQQSDSGAYRSTRALTLAILSIVGVHVLASVAMVLAVVSVRASVSERELPGELAMFVLAHGEQVELAAFIAATLCFLVWLHRGYTNLPALEPTSVPVMTPKDAVVGWFIPFRNLVHGYKSVHALYLASQRAAVLPTGFALPTRAAIVGWWWGLYLARAAVLRAAESAIASSTITGDFEGIMAWFDAAALLDIVSAVLFGLVVWRIYVRQRDQHQDLVLRAQVPRPRSDALR